MDSEDAIRDYEVVPKSVEQLGSQAVFEPETCCLEGISVIAD